MDDDLRVGNLNAVVIPTHLLHRFIIPHYMPKDSKWKRVLFHWVVEHVPCKIMIVYSKMLLPYDVLLLVQHVNWNAMWLFSAIQIILATESYKPKLKLTDIISVISVIISFYGLRLVTCFSSELVPK
jgi:hypothetical protein